MKVVKGISLFFIYPMVMLGIGFMVGIQTMDFFYPGEQVKQEMPIQESAADTVNVPDAEEEPGLSGQQVADAGRTGIGQTDRTPSEATEVSVSGETLSVDTEYVLEETDMISGSVVETVWKLPDKYIGLNREQFLYAMDSYETFPPLSEMERGFVNLEVLSFSRERVVVQMNYQYIQPSTSFYLAVRNNEIVVYLEDKETVYINTGIELTSLPEEIQIEVMEMIWIEDEESLYNFLETYSS